MKTKIWLAIVVAVFGLPATGRTQSPPAAATPNIPEFKNLAELKWEKIVPDLGESSPEISVLRVHPTTQATSLLIRVPKAIHVRKHWHSANETHTIVSGTGEFACDGKRVQLSQGGFNYMPAKMVHEAWISANTLLFITVDAAWDNNWVEGPPTSADLIK